MIKTQANKLEELQPGSIIPIVETFPYALDPVDYFARLSDNGRNKNCIMFESASIVPKYGERSIGSSSPCLKLVGKDENFEITALNDTGRGFIKFLKGDFDFCDEINYKENRIYGRLKPKRGISSEDQRLKLTNHTEILRKIVFKFKPSKKPFVPYCGLFGAISYDFIDQFEDLSKNRNDLTNDPDYVLYFLDNLFFIDHKENKTYFVANALLTDDNNIFDECKSKIEYYKK